MHYHTTLKATRNINPQKTNEHSMPENKRTPVILKTALPVFRTTLREHSNLKKKVVSLKIMDTGDRMNTATVLEKELKALNVIPHLYLIH